MDNAMAKVVIVGNGPMAELVCSFLTHDSQHEVVGFAIDSEFIDQKEILGLPVTEFERVQEVYPPDRYDMCVAIAFRRMNRIRALKCAQAREKGYRLISFVSPRASVSPDATIGENCFIMEQTIVHPFVHVGDDVIIWSGTRLGHRTEVGDHCYFAFDVVVLGCVKIGPYCFFGGNATIRNKITIGADCIIGAGALILEDTPERAVYKGVSGQRLCRDSTDFPDLF